MELIIRNVLVYDGSGASAFVADVAVKGGVIAAVGQAAVVKNQPTGVCNGKVYRRSGI